MTRFHFSVFRRLCVFAAFFLSCVAAWQTLSAQETVHISEFMALNSNSRRPDNTPMTDEDRSYEDWIEIHNAGTDAVNLAGWSLTDDATNLRKWTFPEVTLEAGEYLVVWASDKNRREPSQPLHTNFKLSGTGEYLALVKRDGVTVASEFAPVFPPQTNNVSYGLDGVTREPVFFSRPTPGSANGSGTAVPPPLVLSATDYLPQPPPGPFTQVITAEIQPTRYPVESVTLTWRKMFQAEVSIPMRDDGLEGDARAGDGVWSATITGVELAAGEMLRWRIEVKDTQGNTGRSPAYNVPNDSSRYHGVVARDPSLVTSKIPVLHWFMAPGVNPDTDSIVRISVGYGGEFYDNVGVNIHGQSTQSFPKKSYNLRFPSDHKLLWREGASRVNDLKLLTNYADKTKSRNTLAWEMMRESGVAAHFAFPVRVQRNGQFYAVVDAVEDADDEYLKRAGLNERGALYKMYAPLSSGLPAGESGYEKKTRKSENAADLNALASGLARSGENLLRFGYDNVDLPATVNMLAALSMTSDTDTGHKNYYLYRDTGRTNEWRLLPWDLDLTFGHNWTSTYAYFDDQLYSNNPVQPGSAAGSSNIMFRFGYNGSAAIADMYRRRLRTLRDKFLAQTGTDDWHHRRFRDMIELLDPDEAGEGKSDADLDYAKWAPAAWRIAGTNGFSPHRMNTMRQEIDRVLSDYVVKRRTYLYGNSAGLPAAQPEKPELTFGEVDFNPGGPDGLLREYFTIVNPTNLAIDISGWTVSGGVNYTFPPGTVIPAVTRATTSDPDRNKLYVAKDAVGFRNRTVSPKGNEKRLVVSGYSGQLSARGESLELRTDTGELIASTSWAGAPTPAQRWLRVSEIHFAPLPPTAAELAAIPGLAAADFEFLEIVNIGPETLNLAGAKFTEGVTFTFPEGTSLAPGQRLVVSANTAAFALRNPGVSNVLGNWSGRLDNKGERLQLVDPSGETVLDFSWEAARFPEAEAQGRSLVVIDESGTPWDEWGKAERWRVSAAPGGTPGGGEGEPSGITYALWRATVFSAEQAADPAVGDPMADPDGDGLPNLMEYGTGGDPLVKNGAPVETLLVTVDGQARPALKLRRRKNTSDLVWRLEHGPTLSAWTETAPEITGQPADHGDGTETVTILLPQPGQPGASVFARLKVSLAP